ncbi:hypothetical protein [Streptomyces sp. NPDC006879]|uniref:hypothetical protein n=1 Tax=Streptomyces sp. NPDC006879 TaxID=3364767 RepID=UPI00367AA692
MSKDRKQDLLAAAAAQPHPKAPEGPRHGYAGPLHSKVKGGAHTKADLKRAGSPQGDRIGERTKGLS